MTYVIHLPQALLGYEMNKGILSKTYRLFWIVNRQQLKPLSIVGVA